MIKKGFISNINGKSASVILPDEDNTVTAMLPFASQINVDEVIVGDRCVVALVDTDQVNFADGVILAVYELEGDNELEYTLVKSGLGNYYSCTGIGTAKGANKIVIDSKIDGYIVKAIGEYAFQKCSSIRSVVIPDSIETIGDSAFWCCDNLTSVVIPEGVTTIEDYAFCSCESLESVTIPNSVVRIGSGAFGANLSLTRVNITDIGNWCGKHFEDRYCMPLTGYGMYLYGVPLTELVIPYTSYNKINDYAFYNCSSITSVVIPNSIKTIGERAFGNCKNLKSVAIGNGVTSINFAPFTDCPNLTDIYVPWGWNEVANAPWGATNATIHYNSDKYLSVEERLSRLEEQIANT